MLLYLHGFASGPDSMKGRALGDRFARIGVPVERADLTPGDDGFERATPLTMLAEVERLAARLRPRAIVGSSLGGYLAALASERAALASGGAAGGGCVAASGEHEGAGASGGPLVPLVLLAPAFRLFERWRARLAPEDERAWRERGLEVHHFASNRPRRIGWRFMEDAATLPAFPRVTVPTLCIAGRRDETVPLADVEAFVERTPSARLIAVEDGHELMASIDRIFEEARAFLAPALPAP